MKKCKASDLVSDDQNVRDQNKSHVVWQVCVLALLKCRYVTLCVWKYHIMMSRMAAKQEKNKSAFKTLKERTG